MIQVYRFYFWKLLKLITGGYFIIRCYKHKCVLCEKWTNSIITQWHANAIAFGVQQASYLCEITVEAAVVLIHGALHQESIFWVEHAGNALLCAFHKYTGLLGVHVIPHALVGLVTRILQGKEKTRMGTQHRLCLYVLSSVFEAEIK